MGTRFPIENLSAGIILSAHINVAFQFSGGKDSLAALFLLREHWKKMVVYHCDSGDAFPETVELIDRVAAMVPHFTRVAGRVLQSRAEHGLPTDVLPWTSTQAAHWTNVGTTPKMQDRVSCCFRSIMEPMHERMLADGVTLIIRGQKDADKMKGQFRSGDVVDGIEFYYPVQDWTDDQCSAYNRENGFPPLPFYLEGMRNSSDCATCTAWCEDDRGAYLAKHHPVKFEEYRENMRTIAAAVNPAMLNLYKELNTCGV